MLIKVKQTMDGQEVEKLQLSQEKVIFKKNGEQKEKVVGSEGKDWWVQLSEKNKNINIIEFASVTHPKEIVERFNEIKDEKLDFGIAEKYILDGEVTKQVENLILKNELDKTKKILAQNDIKEQNLTLKQKIKKYRWEKQQYFMYDGNKQAFGEYDITRMNMAREALSSGKRSEVDWEYVEEDKIVTITDPTYFDNMLDAGFTNEQDLRAIEKQVLNDNETNHENYKEKFDNLLGV